MATTTTRKRTIKSVVNELDDPALFVTGNEKTGGRLVTITPAMAVKWLERNNLNRSLSEREISKMASDMRNHRWDINGETIIIASNGDLLDGQHRLWACIEAGVPFTTYVIWGIDPQVFDSIDSGHNRTLAHALTIGKHANASKLSAVANAYHHYHKYGRFIPSASVTEPPSRKELIDVVNAHEEELTRAIRVTDRLSRGIGGSYSVYAVMYLVFGSIDADARDKFFDQLDSGANLSEGSPILSYRRMFSELRRRTGGKYRVEQTEHSALLIKAWNAWRQGRVLRRLMWRDGEDFPVPV